VVNTLKELYEYRPFKAGLSIYPTRLLIKLVQGLNDTFAQPVIAKY